MDDISKARQKLTQFLVKQNPDLSNTEINILVSDLSRFVKVVQNIYTQPQGQIRYIEHQTKGQISKNRVIETDIEEVSKLVKGTDNPITVETLRKATEKILGVKFKKHGE